MQFPAITNALELLETTLEQILQALINDVRLQVNSRGRDKREQEVCYFMRCGHGMHRYDFGQVEQMFDGLNWLRWQQYEN